MTLSLRPIDWLLLSPELFLTAGGLLMLLLAVAFGKKREEFLGFLSVLLVAITVAMAWQGWRRQASSLAQDAPSADARRHPATRPKSPIVRSQNMSSCS